MTKKTKFHKLDILFWANICPDKRGTFEDYICYLNDNCLKSGLKVKFVLCNDITQPISSLFQEFKINYCLLPESEIKSIWSMFKFISENRPRILHMSFMRMDYSYMMNKIYHLIDCRIVITDQRSDVPNKYSGFILHLLRRLKRNFVSSSVDHFIAVSNYVAERISRDMSVPSKKITTIYNGVVLERFKSNRDKMERADLRSKYLQIDNDKFIITYVGQLIEEKGVYVLLDVMHKLFEKRDDIIFLIVGKGRLEGQLRRYIKQANNNKIVFLGQRDDVDVIFKMSDLAIAPSIWGEAFGLVIAEAAACGIPVIGSRIGGIPEVIIDGKTGILTTPGDVNELEMAIERLHNDKELYKRLSSAGREHVRNNFNLQNMVNQTIALYKRYISTA